ncbi:hypothetical protein BDZ91DRAFT_714923 [Kalaharituber pfeilii]|nr:hypothetical protein BDZ91DRAFT_714923 [Kalaharituber pfeilii]
MYFLIYTITKAPTFIKHSSHIYCISTIEYTSVTYIPNTLASSPLYTHTHTDHGCFYCPCIPLVHSSLVFCVYFFRIFILIFPDSVSPTNQRRYSLCSVTSNERAEC